MNAVGLTPADRAIRSMGIGSSEIAALCDEDPNKSALDVFLEKTGRSSFAGNDLTRMGQRAEAIIADEFAFRHGVELARGETMRHPTIAIAVATPDRRIVGREPVELVEVKRVGYRAMRGWERAREVYVAPARVQLQGQWQCLVACAGAFHVAADIGGRDWYDDRFAFDAELAAGLVDIAERFWRDHVVNDVAPDSDGSARARERLQKLFPKPTRSLMTETPEVEALARAYAQARVREGAAKKEKERAGNMLRKVIGEHRGVVADWGRVTWDVVGKGRTAWAQVAKELDAPASVVAKHTKPPTRTLDVKVLALEDEGDEWVIDEEAGA